MYSIKSNICFNCCICNGTYTHYSELLILCCDDELNNYQLGLTFDQLYDIKPNYDEALCYIGVGFNILCSYFNELYYAQVLNKCAIVFAVSVSCARSVINYAHDYFNGYSNLKSNFYSSRSLYCNIREHGLEGVVLFGAKRVS